MKYYSVVKKNRILPFATTWMDLEGIMLSEIRQTAKEKYRMVSLICGVQKTKQKRNRLSDKENKLPEGRWVAKWMRKVKERRGTNSQ